MSSSFVVQVADNFSYQKNQPVVEGLFAQYEHVVVRSLITSFGLDALFNRDQHGGDVDTIHNVRQIGIDEQMAYKNADNKARYEARGDYDSHSYHSHTGYISKNAEIKQQKLAGQLRDAYTGEIFEKNARVDLDHVISAKEIHDDPGRILADMRGEDLANSPDNLRPTNMRTNRSKKADSMEDFLARRGNEYTPEQRARMRNEDARSREVYEAKIAGTYYTSSRFLMDTVSSATGTGLRMGLRQAVGLAFAEIWFAVKNEFAKVGSGFNLSELFLSISTGIKQGILNAKKKFREIFAALGDGLVAGILSSISTTICNIFLTTSKNVVRIIRETWANIVAALKILIFNPDRLPIGDRILAATKILAVGASTVAGIFVSEIISKSPLGSLPVVGEIVPTFCGTLVTGILSCTLLYFLDRSSVIRKIADFLNSLSFDAIAQDFKCYSYELEAYAAELEKLDLEAFQRDVARCESIASCLASAKDNQELNTRLHQISKANDMKLPWQGDFKTFMGDKTKKLVFE